MTKMWLKSRGEINHIFVVEISAAERCLKVPAPVDQTHFDWLPANQTQHGPAHASRNDFLPRFNRERSNARLSAVIYSARARAGAHIARTPEEPYSDKAKHN